MTTSPRPLAAILLAGGRGRRMGAGDTHKVCHEVGGVPFLLRALHAYAEQGADPLIVVVGDRAEQVMAAAAGKFPHLYFAPQPQPLGTGHATRCGVDPLQALGYQGDVLVAMGDRLLAPAALRRLLTGFRDREADLALLTGAVSDNPSSGRVLCDAGSGRVLAIVETSEIALSRLVEDLRALLDGGPDPLPADVVRAAIEAHFPHPHRAQAACGALVDLAERDEPLPAAALREHLAPLVERASLTLPGTAQPLPAARAEELAAGANLATYLFRAPALYEGLAHLSRANAQGEEYLTDVVRYLAEARDEQGRPRFALTAAAVDSPDQALTFNTPEELAGLERRLRLSPLPPALAERPRLLHSRNLRSVGQWHLLLATNPPEVQRFWRDTYGDNPLLHESRRQAYLQALEHYARYFDMQDEVFLVRSPGRLNLMGRHIDHRGGFTNVVAISEEVLLVCSPREDDRVVLHNSRSELFAPAEFSLRELFSHLRAEDWLGLVSSPRTREMTRDGQWDNYVRAAALRLQDQFPDLPLRGVNLLAHGTIPIGAGLSSSSAVVVGAAEALIAANQLPVWPLQLVDLCGEGEWFVGTRGGANDHAAIKFGQRGQVAHLSFLPFAVAGFVPFVPGHCVVVCNSGLQAKKAEGARDTFNSKVLGYVLGEVLFKRLYPQYADRIERLRDLTCERLGISLARLYALLAGIPAQATVSEALQRWGPFPAEDLDKLRHVQEVLSDPDPLCQIRGVMLFGLAECERSATCVEYLEADDAEGFGELWYLSHDGDRVVSHDAELAPGPWEYRVDEAYLQGLIADLNSGDPARQARAELRRQPGLYACSTPQIDLIVDLARRTPGVKGAQMAGAGLGGCVMILVEEPAAEAVLARLHERGFEAWRYEFAEGAGLVVI